MKKCKDILEQVLSLSDFEEFERLLSYSVRIFEIGTEKNVNLLATISIVLLFNERQISE